MCARETSPCAHVWRPNIIQTQSEPKKSSLCVGHDINDLGIFPSRGTLGPSAGQEYGTECTSDAILTTGIYYYVQ